MTKFLKKIAPFLILGSFLILSALLPEILGEDAKTLGRNYLGDNYKYILIAFFLLLFLFAAYINPEMGLGFFSRTDKSKPESNNISPTNEKRELSNQEQSSEFYDKIKTALKSRYETRLSQKLSNRQPVNLRLVPSTAGTTPQAANTFVQYSEGKIRGKLAEYYQDANGRLLLVGVPGAGKTTLLLQLELELLQKETSRIPVILNLARWSSEFPTLESWIQEILPSELGLTINKKIASDLIAQNRLILLLDGLDEVEEKDRQICLEAIGAYGENSSRHFILSSRIDEYKAVAKDAPVNSQVEVGPLTYKQLIKQLKKTEQNEGSKRLLAALNEDELLREIAEVPFYFNTLQLLFARGKYLHEFNFSALDIEGRKKEIEQCFVSEMFRKVSGEEYNSQLANKYLGFFASRLKKANLIDFELTHLQYSWHKLTKWELIMSNALKRLVNAIVNDMVIVVVMVLVLSLSLIIVNRSAFGLIIDDISSLIIIMAFGMVEGLIFKWVEKIVESVEINIPKSLLAGLIEGILIGTLVFLFLGPLFGIVIGLASGLVGGLGKGLGQGFTGGMFLGLIFGQFVSLAEVPDRESFEDTGIFIELFFVGIQFGLFFGLLLGSGRGLILGMSEAISNGVKENYPIIEAKGNLVFSFKPFLYEFKNNSLTGILIGLAIGFTMIFAFDMLDFWVIALGIGLFFGLIFTVIATLGVGSSNFLRENHSLIIQINTPYQRFIASAWLLYFSILQHWHLRHLLHKKGLLPKKLVPFLNDMVECNILETTGASWRFRHRILQDYFADQWVETEFEIDQEENTPTDQASSPEAL